MSKPLIYLAGAIDGISVDDAKEWRNEVKEKLSDIYDFIDPTEFYGTTVEIVEAGFDGVGRCDLVLAEMNRTDRPYVGTSMEIREAFTQNKLVIVWGTPDSRFVDYHAFIVPTLEWAICLLRWNVNIVTRLRLPVELPEWLSIDELREEMLEDPNEEKFREIKEEFKGLNSDLACYCVGEDPIKRSYGREG